jgi:hypothetical protein
MAYHQKIPPQMTRQINHIINLAPESIPAKYPVSAGFVNSYVKYMAVKRIGTKME